MVQIVVTNVLEYGGKYRVENVATNKHLGNYFHFRTLKDAQEYANEVLRKTNEVLAIEEVYQY